MFYGIKIQCEKSDMERVVMFLSTVYSIQEIEQIDNVHYDAGMIDVYWREKNMRTDGLCSHKDGDLWTVHNYIA